MRIDKKVDLIIFTLTVLSILVTALKYLFLEKFEVFI